MNRKPVYLDNNATTPLLEEVGEAMARAARDTFGNPASSHAFGRRARKVLEDARERTAHLLGASPSEVVFTSGATEANNLAVFGLCGELPGGILISAVEHPSVIEPVAQLRRNGFATESIPVDNTGVVSLPKLRSLLREDTRLICVQFANHETGTVQPVADVAKILPAGVALHCDAAAAAGKTALNFSELGVTSLTISAHKFHGPQGFGALLVRDKTRLKPLFFGGHQQNGRRSGTEAPVLAVGLVKALELAIDEMRMRREKIAHLRNIFLEILCANAAPVTVNGAENGLPHTVNLSFPGCKADILLVNLDLVGVACSTGSACSSGSLLPSPVLRAMGVADEVLRSAMRFSLSHLLSEADVEQATDRIISVMRRMRCGSQ